MQGHSQGAENAHHDAGDLVGRDHLDPPRKANSTGIITYYYHESQS